MNIFHRFQWKIRVLIIDILVFLYPNHTNDTKGE